MNCGTSLAKEYVCDKRIYRLSFSVPSYSLDVTMALLQSRFRTMTYRAIIQEAWHYTQTHKKVIYWYGFLPSIFTTTAGVIYMGYQFFAFRESEFFLNSPKSFLAQVLSFAYDFLSRHADSSILIITIAVILFAIYMLLPTLTQAAAIQVIARHRNGQEATIGDGFKHGIKSYLVLFEYHTAVKFFGVFTILFDAGFVLRHSLNLFLTLIPIFVVLLILGFIMTLLFTYADLFIIIDDEGVMSSIAKSAKLVLIHWQRTVLITILMGIITLRIFLQIILLLLVPAAILLAAGYIATVTLHIIGVVIGSIIGLAALFFAAYLGAVIEIFAYGVYTYTFLDLTSEKEISAREKAV